MSEIAIIAQLIETTSKMSSLTPEHLQLYELIVNKLVLSENTESNTSSMRMCLFNSHIIMSGEAKLGPQSANNYKFDEVKSGQMSFAQHGFGERSTGAGGDNAAAGETAAAGQEHAVMGGKKHNASGVANSAAKSNVGGNENTYNYKTNIQTAHDNNQQLIVQVTDNTVKEHDEAEQKTDETYMKVGQALSKTNLVHPQVENFKRELFPSLGERMTDTDECLEVIGKELTESVRMINNSTEAFKTKGDRQEVRQILLNHKESLTKFVEEHFMEANDNEEQQLTEEEQQLTEEEQQAYDEQQAFLGRTEGEWKRNYANLSIEDKKLLMDFKSKFTNSIQEQLLRWKTVNASNKSKQPQFLQNVRCPSIEALMFLDALANDASNYHLIPLIGNGFDEPISEPQELLKEMIRSNNEFILVKLMRLALFLIDNNDIVEEGCYYSMFSKVGDATLTNIGITTNPLKQRYAGIGKDIPVEEREDDYAKENVLNSSTTLSMIVSARHTTSLNDFEKQRQEEINAADNVYLQKQSNEDFNYEEINFDKDLYNLKNAFPECKPVFCSKLTEELQQELGYKADEILHAANEGSWFVPDALDGYTAYNAYHNLLNKYQHSDEHGKKKIFGNLQTIKDAVNEIIKANREFVEHGTFNRTVSFTILDNQQEVMFESDSKLMISEELKHVSNEHISIYKKFRCNDECLKHFEKLVEILNDVDSYIAKTILMFYAISLYSDISIRGIYEELKQKMAAKNTATKNTEEEQPTATKKQPARPSTKAKRQLLKKSGNK